MKDFDPFFDFTAFQEIPTMGDRYTVEEQCRNVLGRQSSKCVSNREKF